MKIYDKEQIMDKTDDSELNLSDGKDLSGDLKDVLDSVCKQDEDKLKELEDIKQKQDERAEKE